jgi:hypothetical protein
MTKHCKWYSMLMVDDALVGSTQYVFEMKWHQGMWYLCKI